MWQLDKDRSKGCGICIRVCPADALTLEVQQAWDQGWSSSCQYGLLYHGSGGWDKLISEVKAKGEV
ncbi:MAG: 4Fe-4S binding protein [Candidatus Bipolaricaulia bacterium]